MINYYEVLQIDPKADTAIIRAAYRTLMKDLGGHPDHGGSNSEARLLNEAYENLSDPNKRRIVDQRLRSWNREDTSKQPFFVYVRCTHCETLNRIPSHVLHRHDVVRCGSCSSYLPVGRHKAQNNPLNPSIERVVCALQENNWQRTKQHGSFFDCVLENKFFLKNYLFFKKIDRLSPINIAKIAEECYKNNSLGISLTGRYFVIVAERIDFIACTIEACKEYMAKYNGLGAHVIIPADLSRKQVFLSHVNLNHHPADIFNLRTYLFSE